MQALPSSSSSEKNHASDGDDGDDDGDSDDDVGVEETYPAQTFTPAPTNRITPAASAPSEVGPLQKKDLVQVKTQLERLQQQQVAISSMLTSCGKSTHSSSNKP